MKSKRLKFVLLSNEDALRVIQAKKKKRMIGEICNLLKETYERYTGELWLIEGCGDTNAEVTKVLMKSAKQYSVWWANRITIRNLYEVVKARIEAKDDFKGMLYRSVRWYADDNHRVAPNKNGYMAMLLQDIRTLMKL
ncbi:MAG: hypothetical protein K6D97_05145 [Clostridia bacterium]|nr:hypothetical protein [Clostridia bacterium]